MNILLAIDGSKQSYEAVQALKFMARAETLHILHVLDIPTPTYPMMGPEIAHELYTTIERTMREDGARLLDRIASLLPMDYGNVTKHMDIGSPADRIVEYAAQHQIDLILVGARGLGPIKERLMGSVSHRVLTFSKNAVLIFPNSVKSMKQVLLPLQGVQDAERAILFLRQHPFCEAITITVLTVLPQTRPPWPVDAVAEREMEGQALRSAEAFINSVATDLTQLGYRAYAKSTLGIPVKAILEETKALRADLIMMGSRGRHGLSRMVLGSVVHAVLHHVQCPLLVFH